MYSIEEWCDHIRVKTVVMRELNELMQKMGLFHADSEINWAKWKEFKVLNNINDALMHSLVKEHIFVLKLKRNIRFKKTKMEHEELQQYISF